ncbi:MAG: glycosyltransferase family 2 protein [Lachnospiraceae bacterium]|nr:glycosyltransferase family 2 protein [Lachnospiraceae bacterium]
MNKKVEPLISIIVPVYKVEGYVGRAIESIQAQTYGNYELFLVDDGSPDKSGAICDEYAAKDGRIRVIHQKNAGAPAARNAAMELAQGDYYYFMDSDDWAEPEMLSDMVALALRDDAQLVVAGFYIDTYYSETEFLRDTMSVAPAVYSDAASFRKDAYRLFDKNQLYTPWNKLWLRSYIEEHGLRFPSTFWDDFPFVLSVIRDVERVTVTDKAYYHFIRKREESETAAYRPQMYDKREEEHGWMKELYAHWGVDDENSRELLGRRYVERLVGCVENLTNKKCTLSRKEKRAQVKQMITSSNTREALAAAKPRSKMMKLMLVPIRLKNVTLTLLQSSVISRVKRKNTRLFASLKAKR